MKTDPLIINGGELRHQIAVQQQTSSQSSSGAPQSSWSTVLTTMAKIETATGRELYSGDQFSAQVSHVLTIRWPGAGVQLQGGGNMRVVFGSRTFVLQFVNNVLERNRKVLLYCLEINGVQT